LAVSIDSGLLERPANEPHTRLRSFCSPQHTDGFLEFDHFSPSEYSEVVVVVTVLHVWRARAPPARFFVVKMDDINDLFWLRAAGFGPAFAPKNPRLGHLQVIPVCSN
jgi:hypothetical protein